MSSIDQRLVDTYGTPDLGNKDDPLDELIFIILSQMTTHQSFNRVYDRLKACCESWEDVLTMPLRRLKATIKDAGLSNQKAPRIKAILKRIKADFGRLTLQVLFNLENEDAERYLTGLPGVGIKTAKCVLMYSLSRDVLPVDTHVWRVARRLGLVSEEVPYSKVHPTLEAVVPPERRYSFHVNAVLLGQQVCTAVDPNCPECPLQRMCPANRDDYATR